MIPDTRRLAKEMTLGFLLVLLSLSEHSPLASLFSSASSLESLPTLSRLNVLLVVLITLDKLILLGLTSCEESSYPRTKSVCTETLEQSSKSTQTSGDEKYLVQPQSCHVQSSDKKLSLEDRVDIQDRVDVEDCVVVEDCVAVQVRVDVEDCVVVEDRVDVQDRVDVEDVVVVEDCVDVEDRVDVEEHVVAGDCVDVQDRVDVQESVCVDVHNSVSDAQRNGKESGIVLSNLNRSPVEKLGEHPNTYPSHHIHPQADDFPEEQVEHRTNPEPEQLPCKQSGLSHHHVLSRQSTLSYEAIQTEKEADDAKPEQNENETSSASGGSLAKASHNSEHVEKKPLFNLPVKCSADTETHTPTTEDQSKISSSFFRECLKRLEAFVEPGTAQRTERQKLDVQEVKKKETDTITIVKELLSSPTIRFATEVHGQVYMCHNDDRRFQSESERFASFHEKTTPPGVWVSQLASAGFYCQDESGSLLRFVAIFYSQWKHNTCFVMCQ